MLHITKALVRSEKSAALTLALSQKSCAYAPACAQILQDLALSLALKNVLSAAQFCAHFKILNQCQLTQRQRFW